MTLRFLSAPALIGLCFACASKEPEQDATQFQAVVSPPVSQSAAVVALPIASSPASAVVSPVTSNGSETAGSAPLSTQPAASASGASSGPASDTSSGPATPAGPECTDIKPDDRDTTCATWASWGECESGWIKDLGFCNASCKRCTASSRPASSGGTTAPMTSTTSGGMSMSPPDMSGLGNDNPFMPISGGSQGFATRYWDCAKPSCGWSNAGGGRVKSCDRNGKSLGLTDEKSGYDGGNAFTCFSMAPWAHSTQVSYGFAATHPGQGACGTCYQLQFTGAGNSNAADVGSNAIKGKTMVVMATNIGGDVQGSQLDVLIPGGGVGAIDACGKMGLPSTGNKYGGFLADCANSGDLNAKKECVRSKCKTAFADSKYADMMEGCTWFVDWLNVADNPKYEMKQISCPQELSAAAK